MSDAKHTTGWRLGGMAHQDPECTDIAIFQDDRQDPIWLATVHSRTGNTNAVDYANARLMIAAPKLLEALQSLVGEIGKTKVSMDDPGWGRMLAELLDAKSVIAEALGEGVEDGK